MSFRVDGDAKIGGVVEMCKASGTPPSTTPVKAYSDELHLGLTTYVPQSREQRAQR